MSERKKPHNGRDLSGHFRVKQVDVEELKTDPEGADFMNDDVRLGGAVADTGPHAGERGARIEKLVNQDGANKAKSAKKAR